MAESTVVKPVSAEVEKQDRKRKKADVSSDLETSCPDTDLSYLDIDSRKVIPVQSTPQPQSVKSKARCFEPAYLLSSKAYDILMDKINSMEKYMSKLDRLDKLDKLDQMEKTVNQMEEKLNSFDKRIHKLKKLCRVLKNQ